MLQRSSLTAPENKTRRRLTEPHIARLLRRRLLQKIENYEREARRLEIRGQNDAAEVLDRAARRLRQITGPGVTRVA